jgi:arylsulfatase A-like enzyme
MKSFKDYNIILINIDGFRKDKIDLCSDLKLIKENSFYFSNMVTAAPYTFASLHSVFTGTYPSTHGVNGYYNIFKFKKNKINTLTEMFKQSGHYTCCDIISEVVLPKQGFDEWNIFDEKIVDFNTRHSELIKKLASKNKFFLFLHYTEVHKHLVRSIVQKYKNESNDDEYFNSKYENNKRFNSYLPSCNEYVKNIVDSLKEAKIFDKTILILFADHGTSLGEKKGEKFYGVFTYDYTIDVFCMIHIPGSKPQKISKQCRTIDIFPTIGNLIAQYPSQNFNQVQGESLIPLIEDSNSLDREAFVETGGLYGPWPSPKKHNVFCIKSNGFKIIYNATPNTWEFYDLENDPDELKNIYNKNLPEIKNYKNRLLCYFEENNIKIKF